MADFIRQLAEEAGRTSISQSVRLRSSGANNDSINAAIRRSRKGSGAVDSLGAGNLNDQIRRGAAANNLTGGVNDQIRSSSGRVSTGTPNGQSPAIDRTLAGRIAQDLLDGGGDE